MLKRALLILLVCASLCLCLSCDFLENELNLRSSSHSGGKGSSSIITVKANAAWKNSGAADPVFTYTYHPDPLPDGVSLTGELSRDSGELGGTYVIRQGTLKLTGKNAGKYTLEFIVGVFSIYN